MLNHGLKINRVPHTLYTDAVRFLKMITKQGNFNAKLINENGKFIIEYSSKNQENVLKKEQKKIIERAESQKDNYKIHSDRSIQGVIENLINGSVYLVTKLQNHYTCTCPAFEKQCGDTLDCKHIILYKQYLKEQKQNEYYINNKLSTQIKEIDNIEKNNFDNICSELFGE